jgi:hypothetical protein
MDNTAPAATHFARLPAGIATSGQRLYLASRHQTDYP